MGDKEDFIIRWPEDVVRMAVEDRRRPQSVALKKDQTTIDNQLTMARFAMHKVRTKIYAEKVLSTQMTEDEAAQHYRKAMANYDYILDLAASEPERMDACIDDMAKGFVMPTEASMMWFSREKEEG